MGECGYEEIEHTADWAVLVWGQDMSSLLRCSAEAMLQLLGAMPLSENGTVRQLELDAQDSESLLVGWLEELLFDLEMRQVTFRDFEIEVSQSTHLRASMKELPSQHTRKHIKAVTYHGLDITETERGLETTIVFDV